MGWVFNCAGRIYFCRSPMEFLSEISEEYLSKMFYILDYQKNVQYNNEIAINAHKMID